ncbi:hypothetical protein [Paraburkholderia dipogonis]|jgi:hypothetical protein|uniref:hypothetical protein n=1 Tax=Paraburkholderia dipogonis TaxID=1211383 RepID=UPI0038B6DA4D
MIEIVIAMRSAFANIHEKSRLARMKSLREGEYPVCIVAWLDATSPAEGIEAIGNARVFFMSVSKSHKNSACLAANVWVTGPPLSAIVIDWMSRANAGTCGAEFKTVER